LPHPILKKIGQVQTIIMLSILYFLIGGLVVLMMKIFRYRPLQMKNNNGSYWQNRKQQTTDLETYFNQF